MGLVMGAAFYRVEARNTARPLGVCWAKACRSNEKDWGVRPPFALQKALLVLPRGIEPRTSPLPRECSTPELRQRTSERADPKWNHPANAAGQCQRAGFEASVIRAGLRTLTNDRH